LELPASAEVLGPVPVGDQRSHQRIGDGELTGAGTAVVRYLVRAPRAEGAALAKALHAGQAVRSAAKALEHVRVRLDPIDIG
ncbi:MAG: primosome assembly protein PriA, partial [Geodermatophilaceae bacterium]|nr:primosome assembly protein PriA [Geodermatophilaceae bacterium]